MVRGRDISAEIEAPQTVTIPRKRRKVDVVLRVSLHNNGEEDFVAHAQSEDDSHFWHVLDDEQREVQREKGMGAGVKKLKGVHSYRTRTVAGGHGFHGERTLTLNATKLEEGRIYTIRGEVYGHPAETTFVAVKEAPPRPTAGKRKAAPRKRAAAKKKPAAKKKAAKRRAGKAKK